MKSSCCVSAREGLRINSTDRKKLYKVPQEFSYIVFVNLYNYEKNTGWSKTFHNFNSLKKQDSIERELL